MISKKSILQKIWPLLYIHTFNSTCMLLILRWARWTLVLSFSWPRLALYTFSPSTPNTLHTYITYIHTCIHTYRYMIVLHIHPINSKHPIAVVFWCEIDSAHIHTYIHYITYVHTNIHTYSTVQYITYQQIYIHTNIHTYIYTYINAWK